MNNKYIEEYYESQEISNGKRKPKKTVKKSNHKHNYEEVILISNDDTLPLKGRRCTVCGKIDVVGFFTKMDSKGFSRIMRYEELIKDNPNMDIIEGKWL